MTQGKKTKGKNGQKAVEESKVPETIDIDGVELPIHDPLPEEQHLIPRVKPEYRWNKNTFNICCDILEKKRVLLTGHAGIGKSTIFEQIAARVTHPIVCFSLDNEVAVSDFLGKYIAQGGEMIWIDGIFTEAMRKGYWVVLDEIDMAEPNILALLNRILETDENYLVLKDKGGEVVKPHPDFRIFATANSVGVMETYRHLYQGTRPLNQASLDRFRIYYHPLLDPQDEVDVILNRTDKFDASNPAIVALVTRLVEIANLIRQAFMNEEVECWFSMRRVFDWAEMIIRHAKRIKSGTPLERVLHAAEATIFSRIRPEDAVTIEGIITRELGDD